MVLDILGKAVRLEPDYPTPESVVAKIKSVPAKPENLRVASGSLADALRDTPTNPEFNLEQWQENWARAEAEMRRITKENTIAEDRA